MGPSPARCGRRRLRSPRPIDASRSSAVLVSDTGDERSTGSTSPSTSSRSADRGSTAIRIPWTSISPRLSTRVGRSNAAGPSTVARHGRHRGRGTGTPAQAGARPTEEVRQDRELGMELQRRALGRRLADPHDAHVSPLRSVGPEPWWRDPAASRVRRHRRPTGRCPASATPPVHPGSGRPRPPARRAGRGGGGSRSSSSPVSSPSSVSPCRHVVVIADPVATGASTSTSARVQDRRPLRRRSGGARPLRRGPATRPPRTASITDPTRSVTVPAASVNRSRSMTTSSATSRNARAAAITSRAGTLKVVDPLLGAWFGHAQIMTVGADGVAHPGGAGEGHDQLAVVEVGGAQLASRRGPRAGPRVRRCGPRPTTSSSSARSTRDVGRTRVGAARW